MALLLGIGAILVLLFSVSAALYLVNYKLSLGNVFTKLVMFLLIGSVTFCLLFSLIIFIVWPPHIWDVLAF